MLQSPTNDWQQPAHTLRDCVAKKPAHLKHMVTVPCVLILVTIEHLWWNTPKFWSLGKN